MQRSKPRLQDVALAAGVSTATVSRCINQPAQVKEKLRNKVNQVIKTLGYAPHGAARALASKRTHTIGAVIPTIDNGIFAKGIHHLQRGLSDVNFTLLLASSNYSQIEELHEVRSLISHGIDGMVLIGDEHHPLVYEMLKSQQIPLVNLWAYNKDSVHSCIGFDNKIAGRKITEHLVSLGHSQIAVISGIQNDNDRAQQRVLGITECLQENNLYLRPELIRECYYTAEQAGLAFNELMATGHPFSAVICGNDILALGVLGAARKMNIAVPQTLSISGFDNLDICTAISPSLTTINVPARRMGKLAATYLLNCIKNNSRDITHINLPAELKIRETTGPSKFSEESDQSRFNSADQKTL